MKVKSPSDWTNITVRQIKAQGGHSFLYKHGNSLYKALVKLYAHLMWDKSMVHLENIELPNFSVQEYCSLWRRTLGQNREPSIQMAHFPHKYKRKFLEGVAKDLNLQSMADWRKVSSNYIRYRGGAPLLKLYNQSLLSALETVYKEKDWTGFRLGNSSSKSQSVLSTLLESWMPGILVLI